MSDFADKSFDMIERLQKRIAELEAALAQSDAEPVGWQYREPGGEWVTGDAATDIYYRTHKYEIRRLYAAPPRPAVSAGLIEAAQSVQEIAYDFARDISTNCGNDAQAIATLIERAIFRARATDRSEE